VGGYRRATEKQALGNRRVRQAVREKLAASRALTEAARARHLALAEDYSKRAEELRAAG